MKYSHSGLTKSANHDGYDNERTKKAATNACTVDERESRALTVFSWAGPEIRQRKADRRTKRVLGHRCGGDVGMDTRILARNAGRKSEPPVGAVHEKGKGKRKRKEL